MKMNNEGKGKLWVIIIIVILFFGILGKLGAITVEDNKSEPAQPQTQQAAATKAPDNTPAPTAEPEYIKVTVDELMDLLDENALKAESTYQDAYLEVTGRLDVIDSDGKYISIYRMDTEFDLISVKCKIKNNDQKMEVMEMKKGDNITVRIKVTSIGEVIGYSGDIIEFVK